MPPDEKGDIRTHLRRNALQAVHPKPGLKQHIQRRQNRRRIAAAATESRPHRNALHNVNPHRKFPSGLTRKFPRGARSQIAFTLRHCRILTRHVHTRPVRNLDTHLVGQTNRNHERFNIVKTIRTPRDHAEMQIDFRRGAELHGRRILRKMPTPAQEKIIVALDTPDADSALRLADSLSGAVGWVKVGLQLFTTEGPSIVQALRERGFQIFLDLKFHDIPNTAREAVHSAVALGVQMTTIHLSGGPAMVGAAVSAATGTPLLVLGVTVLTSMNAGELRAIGVPHEPEKQVAALATLGVAAGLRGVVCSPLEIAALRSQFGRDLTIVTPGVRPTGTAANDQQRVLTPADAIRAGANYLVVGRPITADRSPRDAALRIAEEITAAT